MHFPETKMPVSSANNLVCFLGIQYIISLIYNENKSGPSTEPCGTPKFIGFKSDFIPLITDWTG